jgi:mannose-6-phosphate isomerase-like protein (cupin superfamily)
MVNFLFQHPDSVAFFTIFSSMFVYGLNRNRVYASKVTSLTEKMLLIPPEGVEGLVDIQFGVNTRKLKDTECGNLELLNSEVKKGYDFIRVTHGSNTHVPLHKHKRTNELFYVLEGKMDIYNCGKHATIEECLKTCTSKKTLSKGESLFIKSGNDHCIVIDEPTKYLIIAKPPLFSRIGKMYELLFKKEKTNKES